MFYTITYKRIREDSLDEFAVSPLNFMCVSIKCLARGPRVVGVIAIVLFLIDISLREISTFNFDNHLW